MHRRSMPGRRRLLAAAGTFLVLAAAGAVAIRQVRRPALGIAAEEQTLGSSRMAVGDVVHMGLWPLGARRGGDVRVTRARVTGVPEGMQIVSIHAVSLVESSRVGVGDGDATANPRIRTRPLTAVRLGGDSELWYLVVTVRITREGRWTSNGVDVSWRDGWRRGTAHLPYHLRVTTGESEQGG
jgi:hypothetical protein